MKFIQLRLHIIGLDFAYIGSVYEFIDLHVWRGDFFSLTNTRLEHLDFWLWLWLLFTHHECVSLCLLIGFPLLEMICFQ